MEEKREVLDKIVLTKATTPVYLQSSDTFQQFFEGFDNDTNKSEEITIPSQYCKLDETVLCQEDLVQLCHTIRYWGVHGVSLAVVDAAFSDLDINWPDIAAEFGAELEYVRSLVDLRRLNQNIRIGVAVRKGYDFTIIQYLHERGFSVPDTLYNVAALSGRRDVLEYFHLHQMKAHAEFGEDYRSWKAWDEGTCHLAAREGHLECLKYLHKSGCPWDKATTEAAVTNGHLPCLQYARENGCSWDFNSYKNGSFILH